MKKLMNMLMLSCKKAAELIDKKSVTKLSIAETLQLSLHKSMCDACSAYEKQSNVIDKLTRKLKSSEPIPKNLPEAAKHKIIKALDKE